MAAQMTQEYADVSGTASGQGAGFRFVEDISYPEYNYSNSKTETTMVKGAGGTAHLGQSHFAETLPPEERCSLNVDHIYLDSLGLLFDQCIEEVSRLQERRDELIRTILKLHEPMMLVVEHLREKLREERGLITLVQLDYISVQGDVQQVKRKLFTTARDCIQSQVTLAAQEYEVAQSAVTQGELKAKIQSLTEELSWLQEAHQNQLINLRKQSKTSCRPRAMSDAVLCRRASLSLQRRLSGSMKSLEGWYEPQLMALLKRKQMSDEALRRIKEQGQDLKNRLGPLRENIQRLELQRSCIEERIVLIERERKENTTQYKETVETLEETLRNLKIEFQIQRKSKAGLEEVKSRLLEELDILRGYEGSNQPKAEDNP